jgi:hypothetical protein
MKFLQTLVSGVTIALVIVSGSVSAIAAGGSNTLSQAEQDYIRDTNSENLENSTTNNSNNTQPPAATNTNLNSTTSSPNYSSNTQYQSSALNFGTACGTQVIAKTGGNTTGVMDYSVGVSWNVNNPCTPPIKQDNIACQQNRVNAMSLILTNLRQDPKNKMLTPDELRAYLDTICVLTN